MGISLALLGQAIITITIAHTHSHTHTHTHSHTHTNTPDVPPVATRRRSYTYSTPSPRHPQHTTSPPPALINSPTHTKPKPVRPPPPSRESLQKARQPPPMKRAHSVPRSSQASTAISSSARGRPYSKSNVDVHRIRGEGGREGGGGEGGREGGSILVRLRNCNQESDI